MAKMKQNVCESALQQLITRISIIVNTSLRNGNKTLRNTETLHIPKSAKRNGKWWSFCQLDVSVRLKHTMCEAAYSAYKKPYRVQLILISSYSLLPGWSQMELYKGRTSCRYDRLQNMGHRTFLLHTSKPKERKFKSVTKKEQKISYKKGIISKSQKSVKIS